MRKDQELLGGLVPANSHVLDLGCGDGELFEFLTKQKNITGYGVEIDPKKVVKSVDRGINCIQKDLNDGLGYLSADSFDLVIMAQSLQQLKHPEKMIEEMMRISKQAIVTFPNFGHWTTRFYLGLRGKMPMSEALPHKWYDTPNIHLCTFIDFEALCLSLNIKVKKRLVVNRNYESTWQLKLWPNFFGEIAIYHLER
ncbi:MAG: methionine biosynthesis protein MetW [Saccharospirillaceae bacterium]|nr:methionine biosynthesis protein MetW [Pseudomonadales bacterium]NRB78950.1 methionine biosynthesis protein MetW [Saccharospirillaceae bacterium]